MMLIEESSGDVIDQEDKIIEGEVPETDEGASDDVIVEDQSKERSQDDYYKNKAIEFERKYNHTTKELQEIKDMLKESTRNKSSDNEYSEEQLQAALSSGNLTAEQASFAKSKLKELENKRLEERDKKLIDEMERRQQDRLTRQQAEQQVVNDPRFQEAFVKLPNGNVEWRQDSQLAQMIGAYMQDPRLSNQPDAIAIASKLAYADMTSNQHKQELSKVKRQNEKLKNQTMNEGGGKVYNKPATDPFKDSMERLKAGDKAASRSAVKEFLRRRNATK